METDMRPVRGALAELGWPVESLPVRRTPDESLLQSLLEQHHYPGYQQPGGHLKYIGGQSAACPAWSSAPRHLGRRNRG
jgi:hypothetical protein